MSDLAYTLSERRSRLQWKTYTTASTTAELTSTLSLDQEGSPAPATLSSRKPRIGFVFTGQGAQWPRMGAELMAYPVFKESIEAATAYLQDVCGCPWSAAEELQKDKSTSLVNSSGYSHGLCTILQVALVDLLRNWDIEPTAVVGHSGGEIAAAYAFGALTREDVWTLSYRRGWVSSFIKKKAPKLDGSMMAASLSKEKAEELIDKVTEGHLVVGCINSPTSVTISGDSAAVNQLIGIIQEEEGNVFTRKLMVDTAYHSPHMQVISEDYRAVIAHVKPSPVQGNCTMYSTVTGAIVEDATQLGVDHYVASLTSPRPILRGTTRHNPSDSRRQTRLRELRGRLDRAWTTLHIARTVVSDHERVRNHECPLLLSSYPES